MTSRLIVNSIRHTGASADAITLDNSGNATFPANVTCSGTATGFGGGKILQVVSTTKTDTASSSSSSFADISGMAVTITPSATSSKIYLTGYVHLGINDSRYSIYLKFTGGNTASYIGDANTGIECANHVRMSDANSGYEQKSSPLMYLDSPNTTSAITYQLQWAIQSSQTAYINRAYTLDSDRGNTASTLTAMEVSA